MQVNDSRKFVLLVQLMQKRNQEYVRSLMAPQETLEAALQRVLKQVNLHCTNGKKLSDKS